MAYLNQAPQSVRRRWPIRLLLSLFMLVFPLFLCGGIASGYYFYDTVRNYVAYANLPDYGSVSPSNAAQQPAAATVAAPPNVAAGERVNVLLMGIDKRPGETGPFRTDTMIVATFDPKTRTGGMLSIPRDLYVPIPFPGIGENRINTANFFGDLNRYPGGGPALAKKTVEYNLGIPIHYYVWIDFQGFRKIVDTLGGIDIDVPAAIDDSAYPTENYGVETIHIPAGHIHMNGDLALKYARTRHTTSDFDRSRRQMQIILACREKALKLNMIPQVPQLWAQFQDTVHTDLTLNQLLALAPYLSQLRPDNLKSRSIDDSMTMEIRLNNGADVLWPDRTKIAAVVNELFRTTAVPAAAGATPRPETARITVLNGSGRAGYAELAARLLRSRGLNVVQIGNAPRADYRATTLLVHGDLPQTVAALSEALNVQPANVQRSSSSLGEADVQVIIGSDWSPPVQ